MSRLSEFFRRLYGKSLTETALGLLAKFAGGMAGEFEDLARTLVASLDDDGDGKGWLTNEEKRLLVRKALKAAAKAAGLTVPGWVIDFVIQHIIAEKRMATTPAPGAASDPAED